MTEGKDFSTILKQFHEYLSTILKVYQNLVPALNAELESIRKDDINALNESMRKQQALLLRTKNFNERVNDFQKMLGIEARNLTEMTQKLPAENQLSFFEILSQFEQTADEVRFYQDKNRILLQSKLYLIDKALTKSKGKSSNNTYNKNAAEVQENLFPRVEVKI